MKLKEKSIELLNRAVADELTAVHQYMYFHFHCDDMGYDTISSIFKRIAITEMMHVERLAERILFLKGEVEMKTSKGVQKITDVEKMLEKAAEMEMGSVNDYNEWAAECGRNADAVTKKMFEDLVAEEEEHQRHERGRDQAQQGQDIGQVPTHGDKLVRLACGGKGSEPLCPRVIGCESDRRSSAPAVR